LGEKMFDPYKSWLGIASKRRPPNHYELLGLPVDVLDPTIIEEAAVRQSSRLRVYQLAHAGECTRLLNEIGQALDTLLDPRKRWEYDRKLNGLQTSDIRVYTEKIDEPPVRLPSGESLADQGYSPAWTDLENGENRHYRKRGPGPVRWLTIFLTLIFIALVGFATFLATHQDASASLRSVFAGSNKAPEGDYGEETSAPSEADLQRVQTEIRLISRQKLKDGPIDQPKSAISTLVISSDGKQLLAGDKDGGVALWNVETGKEKWHVPGHSGAVTSLAWSGDGKRAVSAGADKKVRLWDLFKGKPEESVDQTTADINCVALSGDGQQIVICCRDRTLRLWNPAQQDQSVFVQPDASARCAAFAPDGKTILCGNDNGTLFLWRFASELKGPSFGGHAGPVQSVAFSSDGRKALSGGADKTMKLWDLETGKALRTFRGHPEAVKCVALSPDGKRAVSGAADGNGRIWDVETGLEMLVFPFPIEALYDVAYSRDGNRIVFSGSGGSKNLHWWWLSLPR
jgi:WD40 repeat protein